MEKRDFLVPALGSDLNGESLSSQAKLNPRGWSANQGVQLNPCPVGFLLYKHQIPSSCWCHFVPVYAAPGEGGVGQLRNAGPHWDRRAVPQPLRELRSAV